MTYQARRGMYWSIVARDARGVIVGNELVRYHENEVRAAWKRMLDHRPELSPEVTELVLRDTTNRVRDRLPVAVEAA